MQRTYGKRWLEGREAVECADKMRARNMGIGELLDRIHGRYIAQFEGKLGAHKTPGARVLSEVALVSKDGVVVREGTLNLPIRIDLVVMTDGNAPARLSVDSDVILSFEPIKFRWEDELQVEVHPFHWDSLRLLVGNLAGVSNWSPLTDWFMKWFREDEDGAGELLGLVHFLSDPKNVEDSVEFKIDLGSAPVEAFEGLLDALVALGATHARFGQ